MFIGVSSNCSIATYEQSLQFCGYDEVTLANISTLEINAHLEILEGSTVIKNFGFDFPLGGNYSNCYTICISPNTSVYQANVVLEYVDNVSTYSDRKYHLNNISLSTTLQTVSLYLLQDSIASDIIVTLYDKNLGERLANYYVNFLRYYPETDDDVTSAAYRTVEVEKTDSYGQTLAKLVLGDVWYKLLVLDSNNRVVFTTGIEKILTTDKLLPIDLQQSSLMSYNQLLNMSGDLVCSYDTSICSFTWSNPTGTDVTGILQVYRTTGFAKILVYEADLTTSTGTLSYQLTNTTNKKFWVGGYVRR